MANLTFTNTSNNIADITLGVATDIGPAFGGVLVFIIFVTFYALTSRYGATTAFLSSTFMASMSGLVMMFAGLTTWQVVVVPVMLFLLAFAYRFWQER